MLLGNVRRDMHTDYRTNLDASHLITPLSTPLSASSTNIRTPITPQQTMMNYAHTPYRYTTVCSKSFRFEFHFWYFSGDIAFFTTTIGNNDIS
jgi:hypothetical protein